MKKIFHILEFFLLVILFIVFQLIPLNLVSLIGGKLFKLFGPLSKSHQVAISNYKIIFPKLSKQKVKIGILRSWDQLGRTIAELFVLNKILNNKNNRIKIFGTDYLSQIKEKKEQVIFFGIHQANWELLVPSIDRFGVKVGAVYRHINNPYINRLILFIRTKTLRNKDTFFTPKGKKSARDILSAVNKGLSIVILIDQKDNAGSNVKLFNHNVKTQLGFLKIAKKYNLKLVPTQVTRNNINNFNIIFHPPLLPFSKHKKYNEVMSEIHKLIEKWIEKNPNQWLWQHKRFS